ncbi:MAG: hypothetical protein A3C30_00450 [Candidatus Levybacteria bacterium RIFCSPHIGHO2_02_FULL_40_18]|nr:MAG: hypothetical protein A2869_04145 [Candidatus Levybacteria bacterium RIFCSPHIGHO2_01_FULL_40_58]OGH27172.1 MAG: hypothetical protein A3C30_00450 [Candidatus Levybacteria bacterium RIFCSPHIGHO2_02_FULL_40_18]OGH31031.1 MAG: hypothetical protein A3E43_04865 [Candidatus Levybacteria bacterium RIFCSPHIGHO2_12_FULL_40_31]OGH41042.1 MAG: hypothetical protein A2894_02080 [Candidatus Levybacteria bacterium RIFCSPLOWO2_01_FULL_40_64]OGH49438.1 MAG: hypothetical protein A3I54_02215 [Candidatus Lev
MKPQDLIFLIILLGLLFRRKPEWFTLVGLLCLVLAIPLFSAWVFFTAQRLTYYAAAFFLAAIIIYLIQNRKH